MKKHNLHTHTTYSDGNNTPEELVRKAIDERLEVLGISDHGFTRKTKSLDETTIPRYIEHLKCLRERTAGIEIKIGLEIDALKTCGTNPQNLPFDIINKLDYVLFEDVRLPDKFDPLYRGIESIVSIRDRLTIPVGLAHTNLYDAFYGKEEETVKILGENDIFFELNLKYIPDIRFVFQKVMLENLKKYGVKFTIGTDVHSREDSVGKIELAFKYLIENGLRPHEMVC